MGNEIYQLVEASDAMSFEFTSVGPKGRIAKLVIYSKVHPDGIYNLLITSENFIFNVNNLLI